jgi:hypothetical protein
MKNEGASREIYYHVRLYLLNHRYPCVASPMSVGYKSVKLAALRNFRPLLPLLPAVPPRVRDAGKRTKSGTLADSSYLVTV